MAESGGEERCQQLGASDPIKSALYLELVLLYQKLKLAEGKGRSVLAHATKKSEVVLAAGVVSQVFERYHKQHGSLKIFILYSSDLVSHPARYLACHHEKTPSWSGLLFHQLSTTGRETAPLLR